MRLETHSPAVSDDAGGSYWMRLVMINIMRPMQTLQVCPLPRLPEPTSPQGLDGPRPTLPPAAVAVDAAVAPAMVARQLGKC